MANDKTTTRLDIQVLRGLAVGLVVLYHAKLLPIPGGYLGVDIFFVISGFLITGLVRRSMEAGRFSFTEFYFRRAKRLLPAAYCTFFFTAILGLALLNAKEIADLGWQLLGSVTYTANFVLWQQAGYFAGPSELKPLLHIWSLSVEEQYYLVLPLAMWLAGRRRWLALMLGLLGLSALACVAGMHYKPVATFFMLPTRAWELCIGSVGALLASRAGVPLAQRALRLAFLPAAALLVLVPLFPLESAHPGANAVIVCLATLVVILRGHPMARPALPMRAMARLGDISYSLYLVHWPLIALLNNLWVGPQEPSRLLGWRLGLVVASLALGWLQYRFVESYWRAAPLRLSRPVLARTALASLALVAVVPVSARLWPHAGDYASLLRPNVGLHETCNYAGTFSNRAECRSAPRAQLMVWGDSYGMHLVPGLADTMGGTGLVQATKTACGPLLDLAPWRTEPLGTGMIMDVPWARGCMAFNDSVLQYLQRDDAVQVVVLASAFRAYVASDSFRHIVRSGESEQELGARADTAVAAAKATVQRLRAAGKRVVVFAPPPDADFDIGHCLERTLSHRLVLGAPAGCEIDQAAYRHDRADVLRLMQRLSDEADVPVVGLEQALCDGQRCRTLLDGTILYVDSGHLTYEGSRLLARRHGLFERLMAAAR